MAEPTSGSAVEELHFVHTLHQSEIWQRTLHSFDLQHSVRGSDSNSKRLPKLSIGRDTVVGIATRCGLDVPGIASRWGRNFPHPSRLDLGPTQPSIQWVKGLSEGKGVIKPGRGVDHPLPSRAEIKERVEL